MTPEMEYLIDIQAKLAAGTAVYVAPIDYTYGYKGKKCTRKGYIIDRTLKARIPFIAPKDKKAYYVNGRLTWSSAEPKILFEDNSPSLEDIYTRSSSKLNYSLISYHGSYQV